MAIALPILHLILLMLSENDFDFFHTLSWRNKVFIKWKNSRESLNLLSSKVFRRIGGNSDDDWVH